MGDRDFRGMERAEYAVILQLPLLVCKIIQIRKGTIKMEYCKKCVQPDTRPQIVFKDGVCGACLWEEKKKKINWIGRKYKLLDIVEWAKDNAKYRNTYDCALGVSGGKDSTLVALYAKEELGLNCLLVSAAPDQITEVGQHNFNNLLSKGFDCVRIYTDINLVKQLMKRDFLEYCHFRKANEYPLWASTYKIAFEKDIPLVIQGENAALTLGVSKDMNTDWDASTVYKTNTIAGATAADHFHEIPKNRLYTFQFPDLSTWEGKAIWFNYFFKDWSQYDNAQFAIKHGLKVREDSLDAIGRIHPWTCLDSDFHIVSQMHKYYKYGFGFATDEVCYDIREDRMTREEGMELVKQYDGKCDRKYIKAFCDFVGISEKEHWDTVAKFKKYDPWNRWEEQTKGILRKTRR